ncbi:hypothetical protein BDZ89DRAFT_259901 [Hymenopellis radicata]|nr:hypothetical protein BDZ89DRAFT_259901 [Hymenopellis radicata]
MLAWIDEKKAGMFLVPFAARHRKASPQCIIREVSDYSLDVLNPYDAFRLFNLMKCQGSAALKSQIHKSVDAGADDAFAAVLSADYKSWREDKLVLGADEESGVSRVSRWRTGVASSFE